MGKTLFQMSRVRSTTDAENLAGSFAEMFPFQSSLRHRHDGNSESVGSRKPNPNTARHLSWDTLPPGRTQAEHDSYRDFPHLETPRQNSVVERHGALFKMAFEKACSLEAPTTVAEVNELIDFTFAELNRRVGRAGFSPGQRVFGRQLRLPLSFSKTISLIPT